MTNKTVTISLIMCLSVQSYAVSFESSQLYEFQNEKQNLKLQHEKERDTLKNEQTALGNKILNKTIELDKIHTEIMSISNNLHAYEVYTKSCHEIYDMAVDKYKINRDKLFKKYPHRKDELNDNYYTYLNNEKSEFTSCLINTTKKIGTLKDIKVKLETIQEDLEIGQDSIPNLEIEQEKLKQKIINLISLINSYENQNGKEH